MSVLAAAFSITTAFAAGVLLSDFIKGLISSLKP